MSEKKEKKYIIDNPVLMAEWDWEKNKLFGLDPNTLTQGSHIKTWWICPKGHSYDAQIKNKVSGNGCSYCAGKKVLKGFNDLETFYPQIASEWHRDKNGNQMPSTVTFASNKKVWWECKICGGEYEAHIVNRTAKKSSCPFCASQKVLIGYNDLLSQNPELASEWSKKNSIKPTEVTIHSKKIVYWTCPLGHDDYLTSIQQRSNRQGCPICAQQSQTSFPEQAVFFYIKKIYPDAINRFIFEKKYEIDIYIPSLKLGIEYNGYFSHKGKEFKDKAKKEKLNNNGISLIVIKEYKKEVEKINADYYVHERTNASDLNALITNLLKDISGAINFKIDVSKDMIQIQEQYVIKKTECSIANLRPDLIKEWDFENNGKMTPDLVTVGSSLKFSWICPICNRSYLCAPKDKVRGSSCPAHRNKIIIKGSNDFASKYPNLLKYWDYENNNIKPDEVYYNSRKIFNWICDKGHHYPSSNVNIVKSKGCPICLNKRVLKGFNDLLSQNSELAKEWDYELNTIKPDEIYYKNQRISIHWICKTCGYKWISKIIQRTDCPNCKKQRFSINVYNISDASFYGTFKNARDLCNHFGLEYNKQNGNIFQIIKRKQKSLLGKYVLRHPYDDEFSDK